MPSREQREFIEGYVSRIPLPRPSPDDLRRFREFFGYDFHRRPWPVVGVLKFDEWARTRPAGVRVLRGKKSPAKQGSFVCWIESAGVAVLRAKDGSYVPATRELPQDRLHGLEVAMWAQSGTRSPRPVHPDLKASDPRIEQKALAVGSRVALSSDVTQMGTVKRLVDSDPDDRPCPPMYLVSWDSRAQSWHSPRNLIAIAM